MSKNVRYYGDGSGFTMKMAVTANASSGDSEVLNDLVVDLITDADSNDEATVRIPCPYAVEVSVTGADSVGNAAIAIGEKVYNDAGTINKDATNGVFYGYALEAVSSGATSSILVARAAG